MPNDGPISFGTYRDAHATMRIRCKPLKNRFDPTGTEAKTIAIRASRAAQRGAELAGKRGWSLKELMES